jgi:hypothetical protein
MAQEGVGAHLSMHTQQQSDVTQSTVKHKRLCAFRAGFGEGV